uniref:Putative secreted protein n=1 Tax=Anopheles aquasalis TaxID=42839 RepID=T1DNK7_ANOAQ
MATADFTVLLLLQSKAVDPRANETRLLGGLLQLFASSCDSTFHACSAVTPFRAEGGSTVRYNDGCIWVRCVSRATCPLNHNQNATGEAGTSSPASPACSNHLADVNSDDGDGEMSG